LVRGRGKGNYGGKYCPMVNGRAAISADGLAAVALGHPERGWAKADGMGIVVGLWLIQYD